MDTSQRLQHLQNQISELSDLMVQLFLVVLFGFLALGFGLLLVYSYCRPNGVQV